MRVTLMIKGRLIIQLNTHTKKFAIYNKTEIAEPTYLGFITKKSGTNDWFIYFPARYLPDQSNFADAKELVITTILEILGSTKVREIASADGNNWSITYE